MKISISRYIIPVAWMLAFAACTGEDEPRQVDTPAAQLTVSITDAGFGSDSRAEELDGYATAFTEGDACGLFLVRDGRIIYDNVKLTATAGDDGAITWQPEEGVTLAGGLEDESYFLYYPYQSDLSAPSDMSDLSDDAFFSRLIDTWQPVADQSDYAAYTASDLMTAKGRIVRNGASKTVLSFDMTHRMALAVVELPKTVYKFKEAGIPYYVTSSAADFTDSPLKPCRMADGTYRCIVKPASAASLCGIYDNNGTKEFAITASAAQGSYKTYTIDGATPIEKQTTLQMGDYFCKNSDNYWYIIPQESTPDGNVIGVVFWTPDEPAPNALFPAKLSHDCVMNLYHPDCTHGLVISLNNIGSGFWQENIESVYWNFQKAGLFIVDHIDYYNDLVSTDTDGGAFKTPIILGYQNTIILRSYNVYCKTDERNKYICLPVAALDEWSKRNPAPENSTGWYIPSAKELSLLAVEDRQDIIAATRNDEKIATVTASLDAVKGDNPYNIAIFSSTEYIRDDWSRDYDKAWILQNARIIISYKSDICHFRPILAF